MVESLRQGVIGLMMLVGSWLAPPGQDADVVLDGIRAERDRHIVTCRMRLPWNNQLTQLVDAGVPLRFRITCAGDAGDTLRFERTLRHDIIAYKYAFTDSGAHGMVKYKNYDLIYVALNDYCEWDVTVRTGTSALAVTAELLPSRVSRLQRRVDMSLLLGRKRITREFTLER